MISLITQKLKADLENGVSCQCDQRDCPKAPNISLLKNTRALIVALEALEYAQGPTRDVKGPGIRKALADIAEILGIHSSQAQNDEVGK